jgi:two-component system, cell cycle response regulator
MASTHSVALIGFSAFERSTLDAFFRLAARRSPSYLHSANAEQAQFLLVDADNAEAMSHPLAMSPRSIFIGKRGSNGQLAHMPRPINMMALLKLLDRLVVSAPSAAPVAQAVAAPAPPPPARPQPAPLAPAQKVVPLPVPRIAEAESQDRAGPKSELVVSRMDNILVVDDSDIALRFMANCLGRFGFDVHLARSGEEALKRVSEEHFEFVFMDVTMPGLDGYQTCKLIKKRPYPSDRRAPTVVMLTSRGGMVDKMRGTLSGCDAYLTKPLQQDALMKVIGDRIVSDVAEADTQAETRRDAANTV